MDFQEIVNVVVGTVIAVLGWFARQLWDAVQKLKEDMTELEVKLPTHYVRKDELEIRFAKFETMLEKIYDKLENKVDKHGS